jgi:hypothetical protein
MRIQGLVIRDIGAGEAAKFELSGLLYVPSI